MTTTLGRWGISDSKCPGEEVSARASHEGRQGQIEALGLSAKSSETAGDLQHILHPEHYVLCSDNYIGALGASVIANALKKNKTLRKLHMKGNELGDEGIKAICGALKERQSPIESLDFGNNK